MVPLGGLLSEFGSMTFAPVTFTPPLLPPLLLLLLPPPPPPPPPPQAATSSAADTMVAAPRPKRPLMRPLLQGPTVARAVTGFRSVTGKPVLQAEPCISPRRLSRPMIDGALRSRHGGGGFGGPPAADDPRRRPPRRGERGDGVARPQRRPGRQRRHARPRARGDRVARVPAQLSGPQPVARPLAGDRRRRAVLHLAVGRRA